jgi:enediyne biosynthesis protein E4
VQAIHQPFFLVYVCLVSCYSCTNKDTLFIKLQPGKTGITFENAIHYSDSFNILDYIYFYNGGGVATGDINNDGLQDIYFTANQGSNRLYLNKGGCQFEDITEKAGVKGAGNWKTGVTMADVNGDGLLDIYVCEVGGYKSLQGRNELFINKGVGPSLEGGPVFTEQAGEYGLAVEGFNTQASFFDYDNDGDLDMFLVNHSVHSNESYGDSAIRSRHNAASGDKLFRNDPGAGHPVFTEVTREAGIYSSVLGYGLNVIIGDFNLDGWQDIYVSNDFHENDYYYINNCNGTFREMNQQAFGHESRFSMGSDVADINNDGWPDIVTLDMLPADERVLKSSAGDDPFDIYTFKMSRGYHHQNARNCLQLNAGGGERFSDIGLYAGMAATDWSWSPLIADFDNDGMKDLFITNGIIKRPNDLDYLKYISNTTIRTALQSGKSADSEVIARMPDGAVHNYIFQGNASLRFKDQSMAWGFDAPGLSNGAAYADLDNDGDLDLVVNNINAAAGIYQNQTSQQSASHYIDIVLRGDAPNTMGYGSRIIIKCRNGKQYNHLTASRGFQSASTPVIHFGLDADTVIDELQITWPDQRIQLLKNVKAGQRLIVQQKKAQPGNPRNGPGDPFATPLFMKVTDTLVKGYKHHENSFVDFNIQQLMPAAVSTQGPKLAVADVNGDGLDDFFAGGAANQAGRIFQQTTAGTFISTNEQVFLADSACEDVNAAFFDADADGDMDLYVVSGGNEASAHNPALLDRLYLNNGKGHFVKSAALPSIFENKSAVAISDFDHDGDPDIFIGGRVVAGRYGAIPQSNILLNDGKGHFSIADSIRAPGLHGIGMVTDAAWADIDKDGWQDLVIVGEWMPVTVFKNVRGRLHNHTHELHLENTTGLWSALLATDIDNDGYIDLLAGNRGENARLHASQQFPLSLYIGDIDDNGSLDQILGIEKEGRYFTFLGKEELEKQLPAIIRKKYPDYKSMAGKTVPDIFGDRLAAMQKRSAQMLASVIIKNDHGRLKVSKLPFPLQWSPVFAFCAGDFNGDRHKDIMAAGNFYGVLPYEGRYDAGYGNILINKDSAFFPLSSLQSGFSVDGEVRDIKQIRSANGTVLYIIARNNDSLLFFRTAFASSSGTGKVVN